ncbi:hypothetical protein MNBD_BACTEROID06-125, partial [hydrothermal vent metagenome]
QPSSIIINQEVKDIITSDTNVEERLHQLAKGYLAKNNIERAWQVLMANK